MILKTNWVQYLFYKTISKWLVLQKKSIIYFKVITIFRIYLTKSAETCHYDHIPLYSNLIIDFLQIIKHAEILGIYRVAPVIYLVCGHNRLQGKPESLSHSPAFSQAELHFL